MSAAATSSGMLDTIQIPGNQAEEPWPAVVEPQARPAAATKTAAPLWKQIFVSGVSVSIANTVTNPLDMIKTRMQLQPVGERVGLFQTGAMVVRNEGVLALWKGLTPSLMRGMLFGGLRLGTYGPAKDWLASLEAGADGGGSGSAAGPSMAVKVAAGTLSGTGAALICSPTELLKTRMQAGAAATAGGAAGAAGAAAAPVTTLGVLRGVIARDGFLGLYRGATPGVARSSVLTAAQCATYDEAKRAISARTGLRDGVGLQVLTGLTTGLVSTAVTNPIDVVKTAMFASGAGAGGPLTTAAAVYKTAGARGFMRGFAASYSRLGPQTLVMFLAAEQLRRAAGMSGL